MSRRKPTDCILGMLWSTRKKIRLGKGSYDLRDYQRLVTPAKDVSFTFYLFLWCDTR
jgi:hypothetical protein